eukprot:Pgem_evm1s18025
MFPIYYLPTIVDLTNITLRYHNFRETTGGEVLEWFGIVLLMRFVEYASRRDLWKEVQDDDDLLPPQQFSRFMA